MAEAQYAPLGHWLSVHRLSPAMFADWIGVDRSLVHRWMHSGSIPSREHMGMIYTATSGQVDANSFYGQPRRRKPPPRSKAAGQ
jgi:hypothetical protein